MFIIHLLASASLALAHRTQEPLLDHANSPFRGPNVETARSNANHVFNAVYSALRQWGSSLNHNGMSFFPARIPAGTTLYHGTQNQEPVVGIEWLAFEVEHAELFTSHRWRQLQYKEREPHGQDPLHPSKDHPEMDDSGLLAAVCDETKEANLVAEDLNCPEHPDHHDEMTSRSEVGYLRIYQTTRPLNRVLYVDGMSAGKTNMGTLDTQDFILRNLTSKPDAMGEWKRGRDLCEKWNIDGFLRMEAGFELILCDFGTGVKMISSFRYPERRTLEDSEDIAIFEYLRAVSTRYRGLPRNRAEIDYSSMVSAYFHELNLTNPDPKRSDLPRLPQLGSPDLDPLKADIKALLTRKDLFTEQSTNWQEIVDMIVTRYSQRLLFIASLQIDNRTRLSELNTLLNLYIDHSGAPKDLNGSMSRCVNHYLADVSLATKEDYLIHAAIEQTMRRICETLFKARSILLEELRGESSGIDPRGLTAELIEWLDWPIWKECNACGYDEVCFVAMWPFGTVQDHEHPGCIRYNESAFRFGYFDVLPF